ncbi:Urease accessory protein UreD [Candidatus Rhodobacter oscarellae]|uniref:Urease accessory protein UreD n=1 Tax=Candidatus Rhodobacter oscarellae TaxID=1675527 RepID=A0A0J9E7Z0_9RHOB|nr:urease accessory protein UreD [Candidatus Rhodobacter lobularis]KMW58851.1 Urease accessory protein UreD [Candidatus Rhodobacter lobularis]
MTKHQTFDALAAQPRAVGAVALSMGAGGLKHLRQQGAMKALFPRVDEAPQVVLVNSAGGATGGDRFSVDITAQAGARLTVTTQAAERAYRAQPGETAVIRNHLSVADSARLDWLPQEMLLYDRSALDRRLSVDLAPSAQLVLAETLVFGRAAMGETVREIRIADRIEIRRDGAPLFLDQTRFQGDLETHMAQPFTANGAGAMSLVLVAAPWAAAQIEPIRAILPASAGVSLIRDDLLALRILAEDSFALRQTLVPILQRLSGTLPKPWKI